MMEKSENSTDPGGKIPLFLQKTYNMINACDLSIASWSKDGLSFAVKDVDLFASKVLCQYFKRGNFSSFVRQLNLYGFRKVKSINNDEIDAKYWKFKHDNFQRGRLDLLSQIRKSIQSTESAEKSEVEKLKAEVSELREIVATMRAQLGGVTALINSLVVNNNQQSKPAQLYDGKSLISTTKRKAETSGAPEQGLVFGSNPNTIPATFSNFKKPRASPAASKTNLAAATKTTTGVRSVTTVSNIVPEVVFPSPPGDGIGLSTFQINHLNEQSRSIDDEFLAMLARNNQTESK